MITEDQLEQLAIQWSQDTGKLAVRIPSPRPSPPTCKDSLQVRLEGGREVSRRLRHYRLEAIHAVVFRVRSHRGTQFRQWATARLSEYLLKDFAMDDERPKNPPGKGENDYFELLDPTGKVSAEDARAKAEQEYAWYRALLDSQPRVVDADFEKAAREWNKVPKLKKPKK